MRCPLALLAVLALICTGCTPTRVVDLSAPADRATVDLYVQEGTVDLASGARQPVRRLQVGPDSAFGTAWYTAKPVAVGTADVVRVTTRKRGEGVVKGMVRGIAFGILGGFVFGYTVDMLDGGSRDEGPFDTSAAASGGLTGFLSGIAGGIGGIVWGFYRGGTVEYVFQPRPPGGTEAQAVTACPAPALVLRDPAVWACGEAPPTGEPTAAWLAR